MFAFAIQGGLNVASIFWCGNYQSDPFNIPWLKIWSSGYCWSIPPWEKNCIVTHSTHQLAKSTALNTDAPKHQPHDWLKPWIYMRHLNNGPIIQLSTAEFTPPQQRCTLLTMGWQIKFWHPVYCLLFGYDFSFSGQLTLSLFTFSDLLFLGILMPILFYPNLTKTDCSIISLSLTS